MKRWIVVVLVLVLAVPAALFTLLATEIGSRWVLIVASRIAGDDFSYESVEGDFLSELRVAGINVRAAGHHAQADEFVLRWRPVALFDARVHVQRFSLARVDYTVPGPAPGEAAAGKESRRVSMPIAIQVDEVRVADVIVRRDGEQIRVDSIAMQGFNVDGAIVSLTSLEVMADALTLTAHGQVDPAPPHAVNARIAWSLRLSDDVSAEGIGHITGDLNAIRVEHKLSQPFSVDVSGTVSPLTDPPRADLAGQWSSLRWPLGGMPELVSESGTFTARGSLSQLALTLDAALDGKAAPLRRLQVNADLHRPGKNIEASLQWKATLVDGKQAEGRASVDGDTTRINIDHVLEKPFRISTRGNVTFGGRSPVLSLNGEWRDLAWPLAGEPAVLSDSGRYQVAGVPDALEFQMDAALRSKAAQIAHMDLNLEGEASAAAPFSFDARLRFRAELAQQIETAGHASIKGDAGRIELDAGFEQPVNLNARGAIVLAADGAEIDLRGSWRNARWPLTGDAELESAEGKFTLAGPVRQLALQLDAKSKGPRLPPAETRLEARVRPDGARILALRMKTLGGEIRAGGDVGWRPALRWDIQLSASRLQPERYFSEWPGEISLESDISGRMDAGTPRISFDRLKIGGRLRGHPIEGSGAISIAGTKVSARSFRLRSGENRLEISGDAGDRLDLAFSVDAPALGAVAPKLEGRLKGEGRLSGSRSQPQLSAALSASDLAWRETRVDTLALNVDAGTARGYRSRIRLEAGGIRDQGTMLGNVSLSGDGTPEQHRLALDASGRMGRIKTEAKGRYSDGGWSGTLESAIEIKDLGEWRTPRPAALMASREQLRVEGFCLAQSPGQICADGYWRAGENAIQATGAITKLPLALARPFLPEDLRAEGSLDGEFKAGGTLDAPVAEAHIVTESGAFHYEPGAGFQSARFDYRDGTVDARYSPDGARLQMALNLENAGSLRGRLELGAFRPGAPQSINGRIEASFSDMGWVGVMVPRLVDVRGRLDAAVDLGGTAADPAISGALALSDGAANVPDLGLELREMKLTARSRAGERVTLEGALSSGEGRLELSGRSQISAVGDWQVDLALKGKDFEAARLPTVQAYVSPDLQLKANRKLAELTGSVHIPRAKVKLKALPQTAVTVSDDEIIVNAERTGRTGNEPRGPALRIKVDLSLGDDVRFDGFGLTTRIDGSLAYSGETGQPPQAQGTLSLREGRYEAYGQDLGIRTGRLLFTGPIDNPGIDVTAVRELRDVTAGIVVSGNVKSISSRVFSEPPLPEAEAFSYLLTGGPLSAGSESDAAKLQRAAAALGLNRAQIITQQIGSMLGLDELSVGGDGVDQTSLLLGKQITPDIFIRYALGVFEQSGKLLLNYRLTDNVSVQAESGEQQGMDIIYRIEREKLF